MEISNLTLEIFTKLEQQWLTSQPDLSKKTRVLTIDGGGIPSGSISSAGAALVHLENQIQLKTGNTNSRITDFFDIVAGTGIGAFLASLINAVEVDGDGNSNGTPLFTAKEAVEFVSKHYADLYKSQNDGVFGRKKRFSGKSIAKIMQSALTTRSGKVLTLTDTCKPLIIPCYDLNSSAPFVFSRADACESASFNFDLFKICCATSANPSMFKPFKLTSVDGKTVCNGVDGGLVMNNPTAAVVTHVLHNKRDFPLVNGVEDLLVLSLGNGLNNSEQCKVNRNGYCRDRYVVGLVCDGVSETVDQMMGNAFCWNHTDYVRIQTNGYFTGGVVPTTEEMLMERGVESLPFGGKRLLTETNGQRIESFVQRLVATGSSLPPSPCKNAAVSQLVNGR